MRILALIKKPKIIKLLSIVIIVAFTLSLYFIIIGGAQKPGKSKDTLKRMLMASRAVPEQYNLKEVSYGTIKSDIIVKISPEVSGNLIYINPVKPGNMVKKGELLAQIEIKDYQLALDRALIKVEMNKNELASLEKIIEYDRSVMENLEEQLKLQESDYKRSKTLYERSALSKKDFESSAIVYFQTQKAYLSGMTSLAEREYRLSLVRSNIDQAIVDSKEAELNISRCTIISPIAGRVEEVMSEQGENISKGQIIFSVAQNDSMIVYVSLGAKQTINLIGDVQFEDNGYKNWLTMPDFIKCQISWTDFPDEFKWDGKIVRVQEFDVKTSTVTLAVQPGNYIGTSNLQKPYIEGMFCKVIFTGRALNDVVRLPWSALQLYGKIYIVNKNNILREENARILGSVEDGFLIPFNFNEGDRIVIQQMPQGIVNGMEVEVFEPPSSL